MFRKRTNAEEARELFLNSFQPFSKTEFLPVEECDERIIAKDVVANIDIPHYVRAAMDGFAVKASETLGASVNSPVMLRLENEIMTGTCVRVHTGSPIPAGGEAVVMLEDTISSGDRVEIFAQVHPYKNVGTIGEDVRKGEIIIREGKSLRPCDIAILASLGIENISVFKKPLVVIIPTGEELVSRKKKDIQVGEIYETNGMMSGMYIRKWGGIIRVLDIVTDSPEKIKEAIAGNLDADMFITSGGTSVGKRDHVPAVVEAMGKLLVHGVGLSPGKPAALGLINGKPAVCLPGYPVAGIVALFYFARPALRRLGHIPDKPDSIVHAVLSEKIVGRTGYKTFARVELKNGKAIPLSASGAGILSSVSKADGFVIIQENIEGLNAGEEVDVVLID